MIKNSKKEALKSGTILEGGNFRYKIVDVLGLGSFGITYLADIVNKDGVKTNMRVALKELFIAECNERKGDAVAIFKDEQGFNEFKGKFTREADNLHEIDHSNVINVFEWFEANNSAYYSMSYIDGDSLESVIGKKGKLRETEALEVAEDIAGALDAIHSFGLLHLDVKPANIMMSGGKVPVLIDFGLAKHFNDEGEPDTSLGITEGSPGFAPMEQSAYKPGKGMPMTIDVYALGATLFNMITGTEPPVASEIYNYGFPKEELEKAGASEGTIAVIEKAMSPLWKDRYPNIRQFEKALRALLNGEATDIEEENAESASENCPPASKKIAPMEKNAAVNGDSDNIPAEDSEPDRIVADDYVNKAGGEDTEYVSDESTLIANTGGITADESTQINMSDGWQRDEGTQVDIPATGIPQPYGDNYPLPPVAPVKKKKNVALFAFLGAAVLVIIALFVSNYYTGWMSDVFHSPVKTVVIEAEGVHAD